jgi:peptide deformylase
MMIEELVKENHLLIKTKLENFDFEKDDANQLEQTLFDSMEKHEGLGLAANQIGINARAFAMLHENQPMVLFNPKVIVVSDEKVLMKEGCLTWYGLFPKVSRSCGVSLNWFDKEGKEFTGSFIDLSARIILHEYDHLNGYTFFDRASQIHMRTALNQRKKYLRRIKNDKI